MKSWHEPESMAAKHRRKKIYYDHMVGLNSHYAPRYTLGRFEDSNRYHYRCDCGYCRSGKELQKRKSDLSYKEQRRDLDV